MSTNQKSFEAAAASAQETARDLADQAKDTINRTIESVTSASREQIGQVTDRAMDAMEHATDYLRNVDVRGQLDDLWQAMRRNPAPSIIGALAVGFILGASIRRS
jgi:uncharacterized protein YjbJ (UPF0337 family)